MVLIGLLNILVILNLGLVLVIVELFHDPLEQLYHVSFGLVFIYFCFLDLDAL